MTGVVCAAAIEQPNKSAALPEMTIRFIVGVNRSRGRIDLLAPKDIISELRQSRSPFVDRGSLIVMD
jgi:hypothetical protein